MLLKLKEKLYRPFVEASHHYCMGRSVGKSRNMEDSGKDRTRTEYIR